MGFPTPKYWKKLKSILTSDTGCGCLVCICADIFDKMPEHSHTHTHTHTRKCKHNHVQHATEHTEVGSGFCELKVHFRPAGWMLMLFVSSSLSPEQIKLMWSSVLPCGDYFTMSSDFRHFSSRKDCWRPASKRCGVLINSSACDIFNISERDIKVWYRFILLNGSLGENVWGKKKPDLLWKLKGKENLQSL